jgi:biopolymer transport protein TolR
MSYMRRSRRKHNRLPEISLTPLIDTALTLLVIFMVTAPMINNGIKVSLPEGKVKEDHGILQQVVIHVDKTGALFLNGTPLKAEGVIESLSKAVMASKDKTVYIHGDKEAPYGIIRVLFEQVRTAGGFDVVLSSQKAH